MADMPPKATSISADAVSSIAAATAAAIAAGPLSLVASASEAAAAAPLPLLEVRGCTPIGPRSSRFEINVGQQLAQASSYEWHVVLIAPAAHRVRRGSHSSSLSGSGDSRRVVSGGGGGAVAGVDGAARPALKFRLYTLHKSDAEWLTLGQREGQLMRGGEQVSERTNERMHAFTC